MYRLFVLFIAFTFIFMGSMEAQTTPKMPDESPFVVVTQDFSTTNITLQYSRPSIKGRKILGGLLPYGKLWRLGANAVTNITFAEDVIIGGQGGKKLVAGTYALYAIPNKKEWTIIFNKGVKNWGLSGYHETEDVLRVVVPANNLERIQETFSLTFENITKTACVLRIQWEKAQVDLPISVENEQRIGAIVKRLEEQENPPYLVLSRYYLNHHDLDKALVYIDKALQSNPKAFFMLATKASILYKLGRKEEARAIGKESMENAKGSAYEHEYEIKYKALLK